MLSICLYLRRQVSRRIVISWNMSDVCCTSLFVFSNYLNTNFTKKYNSLSFLLQSLISVFKVNYEKPQDQSMYCKFLYKLLTYDEVPKVKHDTKFYRIRPWHIYLWQLSLFIIKFLIEKQIPGLTFKACVSRSIPGAYKLCRHSSCRCVSISRKLRAL